MTGPTGHEVEPLKSSNRGKLLKLTTVITDTFEIRYVDHIEA